MPKAGSKRINLDLNEALISLKAFKLAFKRRDPKMIKKRKNA